MIGIVIYYAGKAFYRSYVIHNMNMAIVALYNEIPKFTIEDCREAERMLQNAEMAGANIKFVNTARLLNDIQIKVLRNV